MSNIRKLKRTTVLLFILTVFVIVGNAHAMKSQDDELIRRSLSNPNTLPTLNSESTLGDYVKYALLNNPGLKASYEKWQTALENVRPAQTLPDPKLTFAHYIEEVETRVGAQKYKLGLAQTFPWFGKLDLRGQIALQAANAEKEKYEAQKLKLISKIKKLYHGFSYLAQAIKITQDNITLVSNFESVARARYKGGVGLQNAVIKTQVELGKLEDRILSLKDSVRPVVAKLNSAMNRPSDLPLPLPENISVNKINLNDDEFISMLKSRNPNLNALDFITEKEEYSIKLTKKNYYPDVTFGVSYIETESRIDANPPDNGKNPIIANLSINLPIWRRKYDSQTRAAKAKHLAASRNREEMENALIADLEVALYELRDADRKIELYKDTLLPKAEQNVKINQLAFTSNKASFLDLIDAQRILLEFQLAEKKALSDYAKALAEIEMLTDHNYEREIK